MKDIFLLSLRAPREGMRAILNLDLPAWVGTAGLALMAVISALSLHLLSQGEAANNPMAMVSRQPLATAATQFAFLMFSALMVFWVGRWQGGKGSREESVLAMAWVEAIMIFVQLAQILLMLALPFLGPLLMPLTLVLFFYLLSNFVAEVHGFQSALKTFGGILLALIAMSILFVFLFATLFGPEVLTHV